MCGRQVGSSAGATEGRACGQRKRGCYLWRLELAFLLELLLELAQLACAVLVVARDVRMHLPDAAERAETVGCQCSRVFRRVLACVSAGARVCDGVGSCGSVGRGRSGRRGYGAHLVGQLDLLFVDFHELTVSPACLAEVLLVRLPTILHRTLGFCDVVLRQPLHALEQLLGVRIQFAQLAKVALQIAGYVDVLCDTCTVRSRREQA